MFAADTLTRAVDLQARSHALLQWTASAIGRGFISFKAAHGYASVPDAAPEWIERHYDNIPARMHGLRALEVDVSLPPAAGDGIADDTALREALALCAYGADLFHRMNGVATGPAVLAVWRAFAWSEAGSPKKNFRLTHDLILHAERKVRARVLATRSP